MRAKCYYSFKRQSNYNRKMKRRAVISSSAAVIASVCLPIGAWAQHAGKVQSLSQALHWLDQMEAAPDVRASGAWPLSAVLEHLSQSIEMSMDGFPKLKSALFQSALGAAAFAVFKWRGEMSHPLNEPIPSAPTLAASPNWRPAANRLRSAIIRFNAHGSSLKPHFAYGSLSKIDFAIAHSLHIANHQAEIAIHRLA